MTTLPGKSESAWILTSLLATWRRHRSWHLASIDSYVGMPHNYYLLMDKVDGKLRLLPWDVKESFGTFTDGKLGGSPG
jgi:spore coat protein CotH